MDKIKINETPVRTSRNFNINNIKLENIPFPENILDFNNTKIKSGSDKIVINSDTSKCKLVYGISEDFTKQVNDNANKNIKIVIDSKEDNELEIGFNIDKANLNLIENIEIIANEATKGTIILKYTTSENIEAFHNGIIRLFAKKGSSVKIVIVNLMNTNSNNFIAIQNEFEENAKAKYTVVDFGGKNSITNYYSNLLGDKSDSRIETIYLGKENQLFDLNYIGELRGKKSNIDIEVQGALKDESKKHFKGTIDFKKGCKKATGNENEYCMLLSDKARSLALPMLLCSEEDVEGNHSTSSGKVGEKELFYIMSRGFEEKEALKLMVRAKFNKIINNIKNEELKNEILSEIDKRLD